MEIVITLHITSSPAVVCKKICVACINRILSKLCLSRRPIFCLLDCSHVCFLDSILCVIYVRVISYVQQDGICAVTSAGTLI